MTKQIPQDHTVGDTADAVTSVLGVIGLYHKITERRKDMKELSEQAKAAKAIKQELAKQFPGIKFSIRSSRFAGGNDVRVDWTDGPTTDQVEKVADRYQYGYFDSMDDSYNFWKDRPKTNGSAKYVICSRYFSEDSYKAMVKSYCEDNGIEYSEPYYDIPLNHDPWLVISIIHRIMVRQPVPAGATITGLKRTDCMAGSVSDLYTVDYR